jgi:hypothetical protein
MYGELGNDADENGELTYMFVSGSDPGDMAATQTATHSTVPSPCSSATTRAKRSAPLLHVCRTT